MPKPTNTPGCPDDCNHSPEDFKLDVLDKLEESHDSTPGKVGAFDPTRFLDRIEGFSKKVEPVLKVLVPPQYAVLVEAVSGLIHALDNSRHPAS